MSSNKKNPSKFGMNKMLIYQLIGLLVIVLALFIGNSYFKKSLHTVMKAPDFLLTDQNNKKISNKDMLGKVYVVEFFYARCPSSDPGFSIDPIHVFVQYLISIAFIEVFYQ